MRHRTLAALIILTLVGSAAPSAGVDLRNVLADYTIASWGPADGLPSRTIRALAQDASGFLWLGSDAGLFRFDGMRVEPWDALSTTPLPPQPIRVLRVSRDGSLWAGFDEDGGVSRITNGRARYYGEQEGLPRLPVTALAEDSTGTMWAGNRRGLYRLVEDRWVRRAPGRDLPDGPVFSAYVDRSGDLLVGTADSLFRRRAGGDTFEKLASFDKLDSNGVRAIAADARGRVFVADPVTGFRIVGDDRALAPERGRGLQLLNDRQGNVWVATGGDGVWRVGSDRSPHVVEKATALSGLLAEGAFSLLEDRDGNIWVGTTDGLNRLTPHKVRQMTDLGVVSGVRATADGAVWVGTFEGLIEFQRIGAEWRQQRTRFAGSRVGAMHAGPDGTLWVATDHQVVRLLVGSRSIVPLSPTFTQVDSITADDRGAIWFHDRTRGLFRWDGARLESIPLPHNLSGARITSIHADTSGRLWMALIDGAAIRTADGHVQVHGPEEGLDAGRYRVIYEDHDGVVWLGATHGLTRFADGRFATVHESSGFPADWVKGIVEDDDRGMWLGTASGLVHVDRREFDKALAGRSYRPTYELFNKSDGVAGTPRLLSDSTVIRAADGGLWFVTGRGITIVDPQTVGHAYVTAPARIASVRVDDQAVTVGAAMRLASSTTRLQIDYSALNLTSPDKTRFRYRLDGFDPDWIDAGIRRQAFYTNLPPGAYRFRIMTGTDSAADKNESSWAFSIRPRFYQTAWFPLACLTIAAAGGWVVWRIRLAQVRRQFALLLSERARLSREIHDTLLQSLVGVALQCDVASHEVDLKPALRDKFVRLRKQVEGYIREARESIWHLRSAALEQHDLVTALRKAGEDATVDTSVEFIFSLRGSPQRCTAHVEEQLLRIGQEAVINAVRHAEAVQILMELDYGDRSLMLRVSDDGCGFEPEDVALNANGHCGLLSMKERAAAVGGHFRVTSRRGGGTEIEATVPRSPHP